MTEAGKSLQQQFIQLKRLIVQFFSVQRVRLKFMLNCIVRLQGTLIVTDWKLICVELSPPSGKIEMIKIKTWRRVFFVSRCAFVACCGKGRSNRTDELCYKRKLINVVVIHY